MILDHFASKVLDRLSFLYVGGMHDVFDHTEEQYTILLMTKDEMTSNKVL